MQSSGGHYGQEDDLAVPNDETSGFDDGRKIVADHDTWFQGSSNTRFWPCSYRINNNYVSMYLCHDRLESIGVLCKVTDGKSEWAAPTFAIPKKDGRIRVVTDFRQLNKRLQRRKFPTPRMDDMLSDIHEFKYATCLDQNMGYYAMTLT